MVTRVQAVDSSHKIKGTVALRGFKVSDDGPLPVRGGNPIPVYKITDADLVENGGIFRLSGNSPIQFLIYEVVGETPKGGPAIPIYIVNDTTAFVGPYENITNIVHVYEIARRVLSSYEGNLLTLRRVSDNMEMDFGYDANGILDVAAINTWLGASAGKIVTVYDQVGGDDLTQSVIANQLTYIPSGQNGKPTMGFDGATTFIQGAFTSPLSQPYTIYATAKLDPAAVNDNTNRYIVDGDDITNRNILGKIDSPTPDAWHIFAGNNVIGSDADSNFNIWAALFNNTESNFWINGNIQ